MFDQCLLRRQVCLAEQDIRIFTLHATLPDRTGLKTKSCWIVLLCCFYCTDSLEVQITPSQGEIGLGESKFFMCEGKFSKLSHIRSYLLIFMMCWKYNVLLKRLFTNVCLYFHKNHRLVIFERKSAFYSASTVYTVYSDVNTHVKNKIRDRLFVNDTHISKTKCWHFSEVYAFYLTWL